MNKTHNSKKSLMKAIMKKYPRKAQNKINQRKAKENNKT